MRGFQGEVLDLIGLRALLSNRVNRLVAQNKMKEAEKALVELRALKDYSGMVEGSRNSSAKFSMNRPAQFH